MEVGGGDTMDEPMMACANDAGATFLMITHFSAFRQTWRRTDHSHNRRWRTGPVSIPPPPLMDDELIKALDRVLSLSGGDSEKGNVRPPKPLHIVIEVSTASKALKERYDSPTPHFHPPSPHIIYRTIARRGQSGARSLATPSSFSCSSISSTCSSVSSPTLSSEKVSLPGVLDPLPTHAPPPTHSHTARTPPRQAKQPWNVFPPTPGSPET